jgi:hypothetical protein
MILLTNNNIIINLNKILNMLILHIKKGDEEEWD